VAPSSGWPPPWTGRLRYAPHLPGWHSPSLVADLAAALELPVAVENDVNLAAVAEQRLGQARDVDDFVLLWAEEGVGAAIVLAGRLHRGHTGGAGEVGYMPLPGAPLIRDARRRNSGGFQELVGAPAVLALARRHGITARTAPQAVAAAHTAPGGEALLAELAARLATGLAAIVAVADPALVILAGKTPQAGGEPLRALVQEELTGLAVNRPLLLLGSVPGSAVLAGALQSALASAREVIFSTHSPQAH
jgi:predicted NBD/HSP70 family sugar kinase